MISPARVSLFPLAVWFAAAPAHAGDDPTSFKGTTDPLSDQLPTDPSVDALPTVERLPEPPLHLSRVWEEVAQPSARAQMVSLRVSPDSPARWLATDSLGTVFLTDDGGSRWMVVLPGVEDATVSDEQLLLEAEMLASDAFSGVESPEDGTEPDGGESTAAIERANETAADMLAKGDGDVQLPPTVWFDLAGSGVALLGRHGEVWRSGDGGETWARVDADGGATAFARVGPALVAGGEDGVRASLDGGLSWIDVDSALQGRRIRELTEFGDLLYAATDNGLFASADALQWRRILAAPDGPLVSVLPDPDYPDGYWVAAERGLFRTDDGGATFLQFANQPLRGLRRMVHLEEAGHLLAISADGVWESLDSGVKWTPASRLLSDPDVRSLDFAGVEPVIATAAGIWRMVKPERLSDMETPIAPTMSLSATVGSALSRPGMTGDLLSLARRSAFVPLVPELQVQFDYDWDGSKSADFSVGSQAGDRNSDLGVTAKLCWGNCDETVYYNYEADEFDVQQMVDDGDLTVINGQVYDAGNVVSAAANVAQALANYRVSAAQQISEAWMTRRRLVAEQASPSDAPLRDRVMQTLAVQELDARLDAWTNGRFTTWQPESP